MKKYKVEFTWYDTACVEAENEADAYRKAFEEMCISRISRIGPDDYEIDEAEDEEH